MSSSTRNDLNSYLLRYASAYKIARGTLRARLRPYHLGTRFEQPASLMALFDSHYFVEGTRRKILAMDPEVNHPPVAPHPAGACLPIIGIHLQQQHPIAGRGNES